MWKVINKKTWLRMPPYLEPVSRHPCVGVVPPVDVVVLNTHRGPTEPPGHRQVGGAQQACNSPVMVCLGCPVHTRGVFSGRPRVLDVEHEHAVRQGHLRGLQVGLGGGGGVKQQGSNTREVEAGSV
jgi:hypothetical protein